MNHYKNIIKNTYQTILSSIIIISISLVFYFIKSEIDYPIVALVLLFVVSIFAVTLDITPVIFSSLLSALLLNYFFIPPLYTFHIESSHDLLLFLIFFIVSIVTAILIYRIRKAQALARDKVEKEKTIELYNTLLNSLSHELRTPLATIMASIDTLNYIPNNLSKEQQDTLLNQIQIASSRLNEQVENLLNMSRLDSGTLKIKSNWCDINEIIATSISKLEITDTKKLIYDESDSKLPLILIDDIILLQILSNLINNAIIHTQGNVSIIIKTKIEFENLLIIQIKDTGQGLPKEELPKLFDKFYRAQNSVKGGTGLGLSIVKGYVKALNGSIEVKPNIPQGLIFEVRLPIKVSYINNLNNE